MISEKCKLCGHDVAPTAKICPNCGANMRTQRLQDPDVKSVFVKFIVCEIVLLISFLGGIIGYLFYSASDRRMFSLPEWVQKDHFTGGTIMVICVIVFIVCFVIERKQIKILKEYGIL